MKHKELTLKRKELILKMIQKLPDDVSYDRVMYHLDVMKSIEIGLEQAKRGEGMEHEEFMDQLLSEQWPESASSGRRTPKKTSGKSGGASAAKPRARRSRSSVA